MNYNDKVLRCRECGVEFVFSAGEQEFYASRGLMNEPGRCPSCRTARRQRMGVGGVGGDATAGVSGMGAARAQREMHPAVCAECGAETMVPFLPRNDKPVYCSSCYDKIRARR